MWKSFLSNLREWVVILLGVGIVLFATWQGMVQAYLVVVWWFNLAFGWLF